MNNSLKLKTRPKNIHWNKTKLVLTQIVQNPVKLTYDFVGVGGGGGLLNMKNDQSPPPLFI